jgi:AcrR family transcriptional regulator
MTAKSTSKPRPEGIEETPLRLRILDAALSSFTDGGYAGTSALEIATRARVSKRDLYAVVGSKQEMLLACINERTKRMRPPADLPKVRDREDLERVLVAFGAQLLREVTDPTVIAVFRIAIAEAKRAPEIARALKSRGYEANRLALKSILSQGRSSSLVSGRPTDMADHFAGLLWGDLMIGLLFDVVKRPTLREISRRAHSAAAAFLRSYPQPDGAIS